jgi:transposase-like protein
LKVREAGRTVNVHALLATGVNADGEVSDLLCKQWLPI